MYDRVTETRMVLRKDINALRATGPRTPEGKAASSRNSLRHGLTAAQTVISGENQADFDLLLHNLADDRKPVGELEIQLTGEIAACTWRLARARQHEAEFLRCTVDLYGTGASKLTLILRYIGSIERELHRTIARLAAVQAERVRFASAPIHEPQKAAEPVRVMAAGASQPQFVSSNDIVESPANPGSAPATLPLPGLPEVSSATAPQPQTAVEPGHSSFRRPSSIQRTAHNPQDVNPQENHLFPEPSRSRIR